MQHQARGGRVGGADGTPAALAGVRRARRARAARQHGLDRLGVSTYFRPGNTISVPVIQYF